METIADIIRRATEQVAPQAPSLGNFGDMPVPPPQQANDIEHIITRAAANEPTGIEQPTFMENFQANLEPLGRGLFQGIGRMGDMVAQGARTVDRAFGGDGENFVANAGNNLAQTADRITEYAGMGEPQMSGFQSTMQALGTSLPSTAIGLGLGQAAPLAAAVQQIAGDALGEGGAAYRQNMQNGADSDIAFMNSSNVVGGNMLLNALLAPVNPILNNANLSNPLANAALNAVKGGLTELPQESMQTPIAQAGINTAVQSTPEQQAAQFNGKINTTNPEPMPLNPLQYAQNVYQQMSDPETGFVASVKNEGIPAAFSGMLMGALMPGSNPIQQPQPQQQPEPGPVHPREVVPMMPQQPVDQLAQQEAEIQRAIGAGELTIQRGQAIMQDLVNARQRQTPSVRDQIMQQAVAEMDNMTANPQFDEQGQTTNPMTPEEVQRYAAIRQAYENKDVNALRALNVTPQEQELFIGPLARSRMTPEEAASYSWFEGPDGIARAEMLDYPETMGIPETKKNTTLPKIYSHPDLYRLYPELARRKVSTAPLGEGEYGQSSAERITLGTDAEPDILGNYMEMQKTLGHEVQHDVQNLEGFTPGTNERAVSRVKLSQLNTQRMNELRAIMDEPSTPPAIARQASKELREWTKELKTWTPEDRYRNTAGEAEARAVEDRLYMDQAARDMDPYDVDQDNLVLAPDYYKNLSPRSTAPAAASSGMGTIGDMMSQKKAPAKTYEQRVQEWEDYQALGKEGRKNWVGPAPTEPEGYAQPARQLSAVTQALRDMSFSDASIPARKPGELKGVDPRSIEYRENPDKPADNYENLIYGYEDMLSWMNDNNTNSFNGRDRKHIEQQLRQFREQRAEGQTQELYTAEDEDLYTGSPVHFDGELDTSFLGSGQSAAVHGSGFYLSRDEQVSTNYALTYGGYDYKVDGEVKKVSSGTDTEVNWKQFIPNLSDGDLLNFAQQFARDKGIIPKGRTRSSLTTLPWSKALNGYAAMLRKNVQENPGANAQAKLAQADQAEALAKKKIEYAPKGQLATFTLPKGTQMMHEYDKIADQPDIVDTLNRYTRKGSSNATYTYKGATAPTVKALAEQQTNAEDRDAMVYIDSQMASGYSLDEIKADLRARVSDPNTSQEFMNRYNKLLSAAKELQETRNMRVLFGTKPISEILAFKQLKNLVQYQTARDWLKTVEEKLLSGVTKAQLKQEALDAMKVAKDAMDTEKGVRAKKPFEETIKGLTEYINLIDNRVSVEETLTYDESEDGGRTPFFRYGESNIYSEDDLESMGLDPMQRRALNYILAERESGRDLDDIRNGIENVIRDFGRDDLSEVQEATLEMLDSGDVSEATPEADESTTAVFTYKGTPVTDDYIAQLRDQGNPFADSLAYIQESIGNGASMPEIRGVIVDQISDLEEQMMQLRATGQEASEDYVALQDDLDMWNNHLEAYNNSKYEPPNDFGTLEWKAFGETKQVTQDYISALNDGEMKDDLQYLYNELRSGKTMPDLRDELTENMDETESLMQDIVDQLGEDDLDKNPEYMELENAFVRVRTRRDMLSAMTYTPPVGSADKFFDSPGARKLMKSTVDSAIDRGYSGQQFYRSLEMALQTRYGNNAQRKTSEFLAHTGIKGLNFEGDVGWSSDPSGRSSNAVIFENGIVHRSGTLFLDPRRTSFSEAVQAASETLNETPNDTSNFEGKYIYDNAVAKFKAVGMSDNEADIQGRMYQLGMTHFGQLFNTDANLLWDELGLGEVRKEKELRKGQPAILQPLANITLGMGQGMPSIMRFNADVGANAYAAIHETGHFFTELMRVGAMVQPNNATLNGYWDTIKNEVGWTEAQGKYGRLTSAQHEMMADGMTTYFKDGKAPKGLKGVFDKLKAWMSNLWSSIPSNLKHRYSPEMRSVFDSVFSGDQAFDAMYGQDAVIERTGNNETHSLTIQQAKPKDPTMGAYERTRFSPSMIAKRYPKFAAVFTMGDSARRQQTKLQAQYNHSIDKVFGRPSVLGRRGGLVTSEADRQVLFDTMIAGDIAGKVFTTEELTQMGVAENVQAGYRHMRNVYNNLESKINAQRNKYGGTDMGHREGYVPHFFGRWMVYGADGNGLNSFDTLRAATAWAEAHPEADTIKPLEQDFSGSMKMDAVTVGDTQYNIIINKMADVFAMSKADAKEFAEDIVRKGSKSRVFNNAKQRTGTEGYDKNMEYAARHYANYASRYLATDTFKHDAKRYFERNFGKFDNQHAGIASYTKNYINDVLGVPTAADDAFNAMVPRAIAKFLPERWQDRPATFLGNGIERIGAVTKLGFLSVGSALMNLSSLNGVAAITTYQDAVQGAMEYLHPNMTTRRVYAALQLDTDITQESESRGTGVGNISRAFDQVSGGLFQFFDNAARRMAGIAGYRHGIRQGMTHQAALNHARDIVNKTNFDYSVADSPEAFRRYGPAMKAALQFQKYPAKLMELGIHHLEGMQKVKFWGGMLALSGLIGAIPMFNVIATMAKAMFDEKDLELEIKSVVNKLPIPAALQRQVLYGAFSNVGIDIGRRMGVADIGSSLLSGGPGLGTITDILTGAQNVTDFDSLVDLIGKVIPGVANPTKALRGMVVDTKQPRARSTLKGTGERVAQAAGLRPIRQSIESDATRLDNYNKRQMNSDQNDAIDAYMRDPSPENRARLRELRVDPSRVKRKQADARRGDQYQRALQDATTRESRDTLRNYGAMAQ
jgi:hypothetical protein